jgi:hypothetical protein
MSAFLQRVATVSRQVAFSPEGILGGASAGACSAYVTEKSHCKDRDTLDMRVAQGFVLGGAVTVALPYTLSILKGGIVGYGVGTVIVYFTSK